MAIKTKDELLRTFGEIIGDRNDETVIGFMEDISDSVVEHPDPTPETDEYKDKYEDLLRRFRARFYGEDDGEGGKRETVREEEEREVTEKDIFKEE